MFDTYKHVSSLILEPTCVKHFYMLHQKWLTTALDKECKNKLECLSTASM